MEQWKEQWCALLPPAVSEVLRGLDADAPLTEIRLRRDAPMELVFENADRIVYGNHASPLTSADDIREICSRLQEFSAYAWENERKDGFLTVNGCRVGLSGRMCRTERGVTGFASVSGLNIRIVREVPDCAAPLLPYLLCDGELYSVLIVSPPGCGKTTLLRDLVRIASDGLFGVGASRVGVADERFELSGASDGSIPFDLGVRTDVISGIAKSDAAIRNAVARDPCDGRTQHAARRIGASGRKRQRRDRACNGARQDMGGSQETACDQDAFEGARVRSHCAAQGDRKARSDSRCGWRTG